MYITKQDVLSLLDKTYKDYSNEFLLVNLVPDDAIFSVEIEDIVTAEYFNKEKQEVVLVHLDYQYLQKSAIPIEYEKDLLDKEIEDSLSKELKEVMDSYKPVKQIVALAFTICCAIVIFAILT